MSSGFRVAVVVPSPAVKVPFGLLVALACIRLSFVYIAPVRCIVALIRI